MDDVSYIPNQLHTILIRSTPLALSVFRPGGAKADVPPKTQTMTVSGAGTIEQTIQERLGSWLSSMRTVIVVPETFACQCGQGVVKPTPTSCEQRWELARLRKVLNRNEPHIARGLVAVFSCSLYIVSRRVHPLSLLSAPYWPYQNPADILCKAWSPEDGRARAVGR